MAAPIFLADLTDHWEALIAPWRKDPQQAAVRHVNKAAVVLGLHRMRPVTEKEAVEVLKWLWAHFPLEALHPKDHPRGRRKFRGRYLKPYWWLETPPTA